MKFTAEQLRKGIERQRRLAIEYRSTLRLALAKFYENRAKELEAELLQAESR